MTNNFKKPPIFEDNPDFLFDCEEYRRDLIQTSSCLVKTKTKEGTVLTITLNPNYFACKTSSHLEVCKVDNGWMEQFSYPRDAWENELQVVKATNEKYHPAFKSLCPVLHNNLKNPVRLDFRGKHGMTTYLHKIVLTKFKDGAARYLFDTTDVHYSDKDGFSFKKDKTYSLSFSGDGNPNATLRVNGEVSGKARDLVELFDVLIERFLYTKGFSLNKDYVVIHRVLDKHLSAWLRTTRVWSDKKQYVTAHKAWYDRVSAQPLYKDLPFNEIQLLALFNYRRHDFKDRSRSSGDLRNSIYSYLVRSDTKGAIDACFYGCQYPDSIKRVMIKSGLLEFPEITYYAILDAIDKIGIDKTRIFITDSKDSTQPDFFILSRPYLVRAFAAGLNVSVIKTLRAQKQTRPTKAAIAQKDRYIIDIMSMYEYILENLADYKLTSSNLVEVHNTLQSIYNIYRKGEGGCEIQAFKTVSTADQMPLFQKDGFVIRSPYTAYELMDIGMNMGHCVSSYMGDYYYRKIEILVMTDEAGNYLACIELLKNKVVQAKLRFNDKVCSIPKYLEIVEAYMQEHNLTAHTQDLGEHYPEHRWTYNDILPRNEHRKSIVEHLAIGMIESNTLQYAASMSA